VVYRTDEEGIVPMNYPTYAQMRDDIAHHIQAAHHNTSMVGSWMD